jgi:peptide/nickel transport system permease protein
LLAPSGTAQADLIAPTARTVDVLVRDRRFIAGAVVIGTVIAAALIASTMPERQIRPADASVHYPLPPGPGLPLGTDLLGRDEMSRLLHAAGVTLAVATAASGIALAIGVTVGLVAGMSWSIRIVPARAGGGLTLSLESVLMRITDAMLAFPLLLLLIALAAVVGPSIGLVIAGVAASMWTVVARLVYPRTRSMRNSAFVQAARVIGLSERDILVRHLLPNVMPVILAATSVILAGAILVEATLSFVGAGIPLPGASWGGMLAENLGAIASTPVLVLAPMLAIAVTVLAFNLIADATQDAVDPAVRGRIVARQSAELERVL